MSKGKQQRKVKEKALNPMEKGVSYDAFLKSIGNGSVSEAVNSFGFDSNTSEWLLKEIELHKKNKQ